MSWNSGFRVGKRPPYAIPRRVEWALCRSTCVPLKNALYHSFLPTLYETRGGTILTTAPKCLIPIIFSGFHFICLPGWEAWIPIKAFVLCISTSAIIIGKTKLIREGPAEILNFRVLKPCEADNPIQNTIEQRCSILNLWQILEKRLTASTIELTALGVDLLISFLESSRQAD